MALHPEAASFLKMVREGGGKPISEGSVDENRQVMAQLAVLVGAGPDMMSVEDRVAPGDTRDIPVRVYRPNANPAGVVVYFHGGGWVIGNIEQFDAFARRVAVESGCEVVSVEYALAPERPYPAAPDEAYIVTKWIASDIAGGRPIVVLGDSSGGTLAAVAVRRARDRGGPQVSLQCLLYPVTDSDFTRQSYADFGDGRYLNSVDDMRWFWDHYLPDVARRPEPDASPLCAQDLAGLPPAVIVVAGYDMLRDEGLAYAERLKAAGVPVTLIDVDDQIHSFATLVNVFESADRCVRQIGTLISQTVAAERSGNRLL